VIRLAQLQLQYLQYKLEEKADAQQALEDETLSLAAGLAGMPQLSLGDLTSGLGSLQQDMAQLGNTQVDALIEQVG
jgi:2-polyprenyl-3-methyl-5-hydroxy-6-metoxy-1,4-benzoquinol methylase